MFTFSNIAMPRRASIRAMSCGVETMIGAGQRRLLRHGELRVAGAGRQIDDENVEIAPRHLAQHLRDRRDHHRPAPDHGVVFLDQKADRHHLDAEALHRLQHARADLPRLAAQSEQFWLRRAIDVGVENAGLQSERGEAEREIAGGGGLADAALAGGDRNDVLDAGNAGGFRRRAGLEIWRGCGHGLLTIQADRPSSLRARADNLPSSSPAGAAAPHADRNFRSPRLRRGNPRTS